MRPACMRFGDKTLLDRLAAQVAALEADVGLSGLGRYIVRERLVGLLKARLRFEDFVRRHPESLEVELAAPVIVVGLPRSGTTHLVNLLAADSRFRSMPWWEVCRAGSRLLETDPAVTVSIPGTSAALRHIRRWSSVAPLVALMHDRPPWSIEEDCELVDLDLCSYTLEWHARVPDVARLLPRSRPARALCLPPQGAPSAELSAGPGPLGPQDTAAPRAARPAARDVPRRDDRVHPARSGRRAAVGAHHAGIRRSRAARARSRPTSSPPTGSIASSACCGRRSGMPT